MNSFRFPATNRTMPQKTPLRAKTAHLLVLGSMLLTALVLTQAQDNPLPVGRVKPPAAAKPSEPASQTSADAPMLLIPVTVTDPENRLVTGLSQADFRLYENNTPQAIQSFAEEDAPLSIGIVVDLSAASDAKLNRARDSIRAFLKAANPKDNFFLIGLNNRKNDRTNDRKNDRISERHGDRPNDQSAQSDQSAQAVPAAALTSAKNIEAQLATRHGSKRMAPSEIALLDAVHAAMDRLKTVGNARKVLLILSDGAEHRSQSLEQEVKAQVRQSDVEIDSIGTFDTYTPATERRIALRLLNDLCDETGGWIFPVDDLANLDDAAVKISTELRNQYVLGYHPKNLQRDGKWRKVKVKLAAREELPQLTVHARTGYYAPLP